MVEHNNLLFFGTKCNICDKYSTLNFSIFNKRISIMIQNIVENKTV